jgi:hypothetical protein
MKIAPPRFQKIQTGEQMKYLLLILSLAALIGTATAQAPPKGDCCKAKTCCNTGCCKK